jgi:hypothetical protein
MRGSDGSSYPGPLQFHDTQLGVDCYPELADDGTTRCLPIPLQTLGQLDTSYYSDSGCMTPVTVAGFSCIGCTVPCNGYFFSVKTVSNACGEQEQFTAYKLGSPVSTVYFVTSPGVHSGAGTSSTNCTAATLTNSYLATVAPASTFVAFTPQ